MLKKGRKIIRKFLPLFMATVGQGLLHLISRTCKWKVEGLENLTSIAGRKPCILMLWHNRLALVACILYKYAGHFTYAALVSNSRDGKLLTAVIRSYKQARAIIAPHNARHQALREVIQHLEKSKDVVLITPDGPRGPMYELKPGIAMAALETGAYVIPLTWTATKTWQLKTWDKLRFPKPFSTIYVHFGPPVRFEEKIEIEQAKAILQKSLPTD